MECPEGYVNAMQSDSDSVNSNYLCDTGSLENKTLDHIKAECINECYSDIKVEEHSSDEEERNFKHYSCQHCEKTYIWKKSLVKHMLIHTGVKIHSCPHCSKKFSRKDILCKHVKTHTGEKKHLCAECGKGFTQSHSLQDHMTTHTGKKIIHVINVVRVST